jgi:hypothetical protein
LGACGRLWERERKWGRFYDFDSFAWVVDKRAAASLAVVVCKRVGVGHCRRVSWGELCNFVWVDHNWVWVRYKRVSWVRKRVWVGCIRVSEVAYRIVVWGVGACRIVALGVGCSSGVSGVLSMFVFGVGCSSGVSGVPYRIVVLGVPYRIVVLGVGCRIVALGVGCRIVALGVGCSSGVSVVLNRLVFGVGCSSGVSGVLSRFVFGVGCRRVPLALGVHSWVSWVRCIAASWADYMWALVDCILASWADYKQVLVGGMLASWAHYKWAWVGCMPASWAHYKRA